MYPNSGIIIFEKNKDMLSQKISKQYIFFQTEIFFFISRFFSQDDIFFLRSNFFLLLQSTIFFKYSDFVIQNINYLFNSNIQMLNLPFPLAISFFTFQTIAYLVDCYDGNIKKTNLAQYSLFIIFFPQLIAGPIVRYNYMMPQFIDEKNRFINRKNLTLGLILILIGLFKKIVLADHLAILVDSGFENYQNLEFFGSWLTSLCFTFQIYFDFSGYLDIATGVALLFNIRLPQNFDSPYKATSIINFWQRWHITLTNFCMNYIYFPWIKSLKSINFLNAMMVTFFVFIVVGIWHGPSWLFVIHGGWHGVGLIINHSFKKLFQFEINKYVGWFLTFNYVNLSLIFFRSDTLDNSISIIKGMSGLNGFSFPIFFEDKIYIILILLISILISFAFKNTKYLLENFRLENK